MYAYSTFRQFTSSRKLQLQQRKLSRVLENKAEYLILNETKPNRNELFYAFKHALTE